MSFGCPNPHCDYYQNAEKITKDGHYYRKSDAKKINRYKCNACNKKFSSATFTLERYQKKRHKNHLLKGLLASKISMRRAALLLGVNRLTVKRKLIYLATKARISTAQMLEELKQSPISHIQLDDLISVEHTKLKPLSISIVVDSKNRKILGAAVSQIPAFGLLAEKSRAKYGYRKSTHYETLNNLIAKLAPSIARDAEVRSDEHKSYPQILKDHLPDISHKTYKSERSCVAGQGELKKVAYDPIFVINHTCAMFRDNINRLVRKTWATTKVPKMLQHHIDIFIDFYNNTLLKH